jgi:hypothetical protein
MVSHVDNAGDPHFFPHILYGPPANNGQVDPGKITQFFQMPLYSGRAKSKLRAGYNWSEGSVIIQKEEKISGPLDPRLNPFPIFEKMSHGLFPQGEFNFILPPKTMNAKVMDRQLLFKG